MRTLFLICLICISLFQQAKGWWEVGHMLTAQVALLELKSRNMTIVNEANRLIEALNPLSSNMSQDFVQAASWMDDIKTNSTNFWDLWHYTDLPINSDGTIIFYDYLSSVYNSITGMHRILNIFSNYTIGEPITMERAVMLRMMIHIVGDMHQPLHNSNYFNRTFNTPLGDIAGNIMNITDLNGVSTNLHSYWDSGAYMLNQNPTYMKRPLNEDQLLELENWGRSLITQYPRESLADRLQLQEPSEWNRESFQYSVNFIYPWIQKNSHVTQEFQDQCREIIQQQVVLGGYRLADFMYQALNGEFHDPNIYPFGTQPSDNEQATIQQNALDIHHQQGFLPKQSGN